MTQHEKYKEYKAEWYRKNREKRLEYQREYYKKLKQSKQNETENSTHGADNHAGEQ